MVLSAEMTSMVSDAPSSKNARTLQGQNFGSKMSKVDGAAAGACILSYIGCADLDKENVACANATQEDEKSKSRRNRKRKVRSRQVEVESNSRLSSPPAADMGSEVTDAKNKRKMCSDDRQKAAIDSTQSNHSSQLQSGSQSDNMQDIGNSKEWCDEAINRLQSTCRSEKHEQLVTVTGSMRELSLSRHGTWVAQAALEVATGVDRDALIAAIQDHVTELYESPYGNYVLSKAVEVFPRNKLAFIVSALLGRGIKVAKHRFGCRVVCRLLEHCSVDELGGLFDEFVSDAPALARHQYGNFIIQSLLEHAYSVCGTTLLHELLPFVPQLAQHRYGSLVVQRLLDWCDAEGQKMVITELMRPSEHNQCTLVEVACTHYGSFVVEQLANVKVMFHEVRDLLQTNVALLVTSEHAQRVIDAFRLSLPESALL
mmetsp:Transcript_97004/g.182413  ORF Transcript_97004/g.182413 Transcript_97004/m.182413 type:complete len:428 (+) Transcript_97004:48-1331(+)